MVALAIHSGIPVAAWLVEDDGVLDAALDLMAGREDPGTGRHRRSDGAQMSG